MKSNSIKLLTYWISLLLLIHLTIEAQTDKIMSEKDKVIKEKRISNNG